MTATPEFSLDQLIGRSRSHLSELTDPPCALHIEAVAPFLAMRAAAAADGIDLTAFSSFRDFDRQLAIWNGKFRGERPMQDRAGRPLDALVPGTRGAGRAPSSGGQRCRARAGTTGARISTSWIARAMPAGYKLQVVPAEYMPADHSIV